MNLRRNGIPGLCTALCVAAILAGAATTAQADREGPGRQGPPEAMERHGGHGGGGMHGGGMHGGERGKGGGGRHGEGHGKGHDGTHLFTPNWRTTLTPEQTSELDRLHVELAKTKAPLLAQIQALKVRLAVLVTADQPDQGAVDALVEELLQAKRAVMSAKYKYIVAQRAVLTASQRVTFDMEVLHRAIEGKRERHGHEGKGH